MQADESSELLRESASEFLRGREQRASRSLEAGTLPTFDVGLWREMAELGWLGLGLPESVGGPGLGLREAAIVCEELGRTASVASYISCSVLPSEFLFACDAAVSHVAELARACTSGERLFAVAWQEQSNSGEVHPATQLRNGRLTGTKLFVAGAEANGVLLVTASLNDEFGLVAVDANAPGVSLERYAAGLSADATIHFDNAPILFDRPLGSGQRTQVAFGNSLQHARIAICAYLAGLAQGVLDKTLVYVGNRVQFSRPISSFQAIRHRCVDLYIATRLASASWKHALQCVESAPGSKAADVAINAAKARCGDVAVQVSRDAVQMHGAMGFTEEGGVGAYLRAALHGRAWLGTPLQHRRRFMLGLATLRSEVAEPHDG